MDERLPGVAEPAGDAEMAVADGAPLPRMGVDEAARDLNETAFADADGGAGNADNRKRGKKAGVPNWAPMEAVACVWAQIAQCEEEQQQSLSKLRCPRFFQYLFRVFLDTIAFTFPHVEKAKASENL